MSDPDPIASGYDAFYERWGTSPRLRALWREHAAGDDFPEEFEHISFLGIDDLRQVAGGLALARDDVVVDLACGAGGPGLWVAANTGARLVGVDQSPIAVERARQRVDGVSLSGRASFRQGTFLATGLDDASADGVMSIDALQYAPDKRRAIVEMARILRPGGRLAFVAFELDADRIAGLAVWDDPVGDYRPLLEEAGFDVERYDQLDGWREKVTATYEAVVGEHPDLEAELGEAAAGALVLEASITMQLQPYCGHVLAICGRRS